jgi:hypothetical protein
MLNSIYSVSVANENEKCLKYEFRVGAQDDDIVV